MNYAINYAFVNSVLITRIYLNLTNIFSYLIILFTLQFVPIALHCQQVCACTKDIQPQYLHLHLQWNGEHPCWR